MGSFKDLAKLPGLAKAGLKVMSATEQHQARRDAALRAGAERAEAAAAAHLATVPHYPWARLATLAEIRALLNAHAMAFSIAGRGEIPAILDIEALVGPAQLADDVTLDDLVLPAEGSALFVRGNLTVTHRLVQRPRAGLLVVIGNLRARHLITSGPILVLGDLDVPGTLYGNSTSHSTIILGTAHVGTLIPVLRHGFAPLAAYTIDAVLDPDGDAPHLSIFARHAPRARPLDPSLDPHDATAIADALATRDDVLAPA